MKALEDKIVKEGKVLEGNVLKVGSFLNQTIDTRFTMEMAEEIARLFKNDNVTKVLTIESSGIAIGFAAAVALGVPMVFAKKNRSSNLDGNILSTNIHSYTHNYDYAATVSADYITKDDRILIVDDFLANGAALEGLTSMVASAGATLVGCAIQIEKGFQHGGDKLRERGIRIESLAIIESMSPESGIIFRK